MGSGHEQRRKTRTAYQASNLDCLMSLFMVTMVLDRIDSLPFNVKDSYVSLLELLMLTAFGAYFAGRTIEKKKR